jgi:hypothetical protein
MFIMRLSALSANFSHAAPATNVRGQDGMKKLRETG